MFIVGLTVDRCQSLCFNLQSLHPSPVKVQLLICTREICMECFERLASDILRVVKCCISYLLFVFLFLYS